MVELLEVTLNYEYANQQCVNRWNYEATGTPSTGTLSFALNEALGFHPVAGAAPSGSLLRAIVDVLHTTAFFSQAICLNPYDPTDFDAAPFVPQVPGLDGSGQGMTPVAALGFRSNQTRRDVRRGTKRFAGLSEGIESMHGGVDTSYNTQINLIASLMGATLTTGSGGGLVTFIPCIVKKEKYAVPGSSPVRYAYRYQRPLDATGKAEQLLRCATGITWQPYAFLRSQTSRQYGRGI